MSTWNLDMQQALEYAAFAAAHTRRSPGPSWKVPVDGARFCTDRRMSTVHHDQYFRSEPDDHWEISHLEQCLYSPDRTSVKGRSRSSLGLFTDGSLTARTTFRQPDLDGIWSITSYDWRPATADDIEQLDFVTDTSSDLSVRGTTLWPGTEEPGDAFRRELKKMVGYGTELQRQAPPSAPTLADRRISEFETERRALIARHEEQDGTSSPPTVLDIERIDRTRRAGRQESISRLLAHRAELESIADIRSASSARRRAIAAFVAGILTLFVVSDILYEPVVGIPASSIPFIHSVTNSLLISLALAVLTYTFSRLLGTVSILLTLMMIVALVFFAFDGALDLRSLTGLTFHNEALAKTFSSSVWHLLTFPIITIPIALWCIVYSAAAYCRGRRGPGRDACERPIVIPVQPQQTARNIVRTGDRLRPVGVGPYLATRPAGRPPDEEVPQVPSPCS